MAGPVNTIRFKNNPKATLHRHWTILIDNRDLRDLLEEHVAAPVRGHWADKAKALVNLEDLRKSLTEQGELSLLICANCAAAGYKSCEDLDLKPFVVLQEGDFIVWKAHAPDASGAFDEAEPLRFRFHLPQYQAAVKDVLER